MYNDNPVRTFTAYGTPGANLRVKIKSGTTTTPPQVELAGAGEDYIGITEFATVTSGDPVSVRLITAPGTFHCNIAISSSIARGTVLYGAASGELSDASSGSAQGIALEAAAAATDCIECLLWSVKSTTAATVSLADTPTSHYTAVTVEAALAELGVHLHSAQKTIPIPLGTFTQEDGTALTKFTAGATPGFQQLSNKEVVLTWDGNGTPGAVAVNVPFVDPSINPAANVVVHVLAAMAGETDTPVVAMEAYFGAGDTDCAGTDFEVTGTTTVTEYTNTIALANVATPPSSLTLVFTPTAGQMGTDELYFYAVWLEVTGVTLTA